MKCILIIALASLSAGGAVAQSVSNPYAVGHLKTRAQLGIFATQAIVDDGPVVTPKIKPLGTLGDPKGYNNR